jgi:hypothetical protein
LQSVSGYVSGGERYAALFVKSSGPAWEARHGLSAADYQKTFDDLVKQGYRLTWVSAHEASGALHVLPTGRYVGVAGIRSVLTGRNDHE